MMMMSLSLCPLSSVFLYFDVSPHLSPLNGLERSETVHGGLSTVVWWSWKKSKWSMEVYYPPCMSQMVLKAANSVCIHTMVLKWVNSPCRSQMVLKEVTYGWWFSLGPWPWPVAVVCRVPMVMFQLKGLKVHMRVLEKVHLDDLDLYVITFCYVSNVSLTLIISIETY